MKKSLFVLLLSFVVIAGIFAGESTFMLGPNYSVGIDFGDSLTMLHGPGVSLVSRSKTKPESKAVFAVDSTIAFPLEIITEYGVAKRNDFNMLLSCDLMLGCGYQSKVKDKPLYSVAGAGLYVVELAGTTDYSGTVDIDLGIAIFADLGYRFNDSWSLGLLVKDALTFGRFSLVNLGSGIERSFEGDINMVGSVTLAVGYTWITE